uniref:Uncharacterized protein n=1 Tax=Arundo donax TaxID=35708 RepID=A0A0A8ZVZ5_ARUDO
MAATTGTWAPFRRLTAPRRRQMKYGGRHMTAGVATPTLSHL